MTFALSDLSGSALLAGGPTGTVQTSLSAATASLKYIVDATEMKGNIVSDMTDLVISYEGDQLSPENAEGLLSGENSLALAMSMGLNTFSGQFEARQPADGFVRSAQSALVEYVAWQGRSEL